jgi:phosphatidylglycerophosphatase A
MPYTIQQIERDGEHQWAVLSCSCNLVDANDLLILDTVALVRRSYGEDAVVQDAQDVMADEIVGGTFSLDHLITAAQNGDARS